MSVAHTQAVVRMEITFHDYPLWCDESWGVSEQVLNQVFQTLPKFKSEYYDQECSNEEPLNKAEDFCKSGGRFVAGHPVPSKQRTSFNFFVQLATGNKNVAVLAIRCQGGSQFRRVFRCISFENLFVSVENDSAESWKID
jgi:hypothetical protein